MCIKRHGHIDDVCSVSAWGLVIVHQWLKPNNIYFDFESTDFRFPPGNRFIIELHSNSKLPDYATYWPYKVVFLLLATPNILNRTSHNWLSLQLRGDLSTVLEILFYLFNIMALLRLQGDFLLQHCRWPLAKQQHCIQVSDTTSGGASGTTAKSPPSSISNFHTEEDTENHSMILAPKGQCELG